MLNVKSHIVIKTAHLTLCSFPSCSFRLEGCNDKGTLLASSLLVCIASPAGKQAPGPLELVERREEEKGLIYHDLASFSMVSAGD